MDSENVLDNAILEIEAKLEGVQPKDVSIQKLNKFINDILTTKSFGTVLKDNRSVKKISMNFPTLTSDMLKDVLVPTTFDGRDYWFDYLPPISQMYDCGRGWLFAAVECLSARYNIFTPNQRNVLLTSVEPIFCQYPELKDKIPITEGDSSISQKICNVCSGTVYDAMRYLYTYGAPMTSCVIYEDIFATQTKFKPACKFTQDEIYGECDKIFINDRTTCPTSKKAMHRFRCSLFANVEKNTDTIMKEIFKNGPVITSYLLYDDFLNEYDGRTVYRGPKKGSKLIGGHTGKIVGWGVEEGVKFWIVSNSWSQEWGIGGYFRIERGSNTCGIEDNVVTLYPDFAIEGQSYPSGLSFTDKDLNNLRKKIKIDPYNYYEEKTIKLIKSGKIVGNLDNFWNLDMIPNISKTNAGEIYTVPIIYQKSTKREDKVNVLILILSGIGGVILGLLLAYIIKRLLKKNLKQIS